MKKKTIFIIVGVLVIIIAAYFLFFRKSDSGKKKVNRKNVDPDKVQWILDTFTAKQINMVQHMWEYVEWIRKGPHSGTAELAAGDPDRHTEDEIIANYKKVTFPTAAGWCTNEEHLHDDPNREVITSVQARGIKGKNITADEWAEAWNETYYTSILSSL